MSDLAVENGPGTHSHESLRTIASQQRVILFCILIYLLAVIGQLLVPEAVRPMLGLGVMAVGLVATVFVFMLAIKLYGTGMGILLAILTLIPLIGLVPLLIVNGKATRTLRENGIDVGLLGAKM